MTTATIQYGRYKRYAKQLAAGEILTFDEKWEAIKARRAWQLYVPKESRKHLYSRVQKNDGEIQVRILSRA